ncbi:MAG: NusG domain II-containing protein [Firmicutes bacterium]|nr:NusG domain II-containing protein [Bacillota bacterium]
MKYLKPYDILIIFISLAGIIISMFLFRPTPENKILAVYSDGKKQTYSLGNSQFVVKNNYGSVKIKVEDARARIIDSSCPDRWCINMGWIKNPGESAVCLPSRIMIVIENKKGAGEGADAVTK